MEKLIIWIANDGTQFDTEEECVKYENRHNTLEEKVVFIVDGRIMKDESIDDKLNDCDYIVVRDIEDTKLLHQAYKDNFLNSPFYDCDYQTGIFEYDCEYGLWRCIDAEITKLQEKKNKILELLIKK